MTAAMVLSGPKQSGGRTSEGLQFSTRIRRTVFSIPVSLAALIGLASYTIFACLCRWKIAQFQLFFKLSSLFCFCPQPHFVSSTTDHQMEKVGLKSFCLVNVHLRLKAKQHNHLYEARSIILLRNKLDCNEVHPYIAALPILAFALLRNMVGCIRSRYSRWQSRVREFF